MILKDCFMSFIIIFCLISELINFLELKNVIGFVNVFSVEVVWVLIVAFCVDVIFKIFNKIMEKKDVYVS